MLAGSNPCIPFGQGFGNKSVVEATRPIQSQGTALYVTHASPMSMAHNGHNHFHDLHTFHHLDKCEGMSVTLVLGVRIVETTHPTQVQDEVSWAMHSPPSLLWL
ncbi:hypothetical protein E2C01_040091 [Portunus trituberculatus]|uniref:Uncharacterized protein n=1 Tax=Portunus trituberculatus TaxID=210409 RepID=A0A5B7FIR0_PORTR|nr:hypothetical protein [Portunus trituberculatus]